MSSKHLSETNCEFCATAHDSFCSILCHHPQVHRSCRVYKKNQILFYEETQPKGVYCLNLGKVKLFKTNSNGKEQIVHLASTG